jgi:hypothetical protein
MFVIFLSAIKINHYSLSLQKKTIPERIEQKMIAKFYTPHPGLKQSIPSVLISTNFRDLKSAFQAK